MGVRASGELNQGMLLDLPIGVLAGVASRDRGEKRALRGSEGWDHNLTVEGSRR